MKKSNGFITFFCHPDPSLAFPYVKEHLCPILEMYKLSYRILEDNKVYPEVLSLDTCIIFEIESPILDKKAKFYLNMILQGAAGMILLNKDVFSFQFFPFS
ncbi:MAG: hypothetical protein M0O93_06940 [Bacteroidales bacterium]|nr:hypothetical protein [Bacteroidales bacterium]